MAEGVGSEPLWKGCQGKPDRGGPEQGERRSRDTGSRAQGGDRDNWTLVRPLPILGDVPPVGRSAEQRHPGEAEQEDGNGIGGGAVHPGSIAPTGLSDKRFPQFKRGAIMSPCLKCLISASPHPGSFRKG